MVRYGILGFGHHGRRRLAPAFVGAKSSQLAGIWRRDSTKAKADARELGIAQVFSSAEALCASPDIDAVFVSSPDAFHLRDTLLALAHNKPVLCEKPLAMSVQEVEQMLIASRNANVLFGAAQNFRYNRSVELVRAWIQAGRIGRPIFATANFNFLSERSPRAWIYDPSLARGGPIGDVGIHCLDALRFILQDDVTAVATLAR
ncbi:MAG: Gfo/Idh/MocA family protein, partial [Acidobacteriaceae bacterium]